MNSLNGVKMESNLDNIDEMIKGLEFANSLQEEERILGRLNPLETKGNTRRVIDHFGEKDGKVVMTMVLKAKDNCKLELEKCLKNMMAVVNKTLSVDAVTLVLPYPGSDLYLLVIHHRSRSDLVRLFGSQENPEFTKLLSTRDSLLISPPTYQFEEGNAVTIEPTSGKIQELFTSQREVEVVDTSGPPESDAELCYNDSCYNPNGLQVEAAFVSMRGGPLFKSRYLRNSKKGGHKNLRCFPDCRNGVHVSSGFCGDSIKVHVSISRVTSTGGIRVCGLRSSKSNRTLAYARFIPYEAGVLDEETLESSGPLVSVGDTFEVEEIDKLVRDRDHPQRPWVPGVFKGASGDGALQAAIFEFNGDFKAWHYGWAAPRGQGQQGNDPLHCFEALFFKPFRKKLYCVYVLQSDPFSIGSSRKPPGSSAASDASGGVEDVDLDLLPSSPPPPDEPFLKRKRANISTITPTDIPWVDLYSMFSIPPLPTDGGLQQSVDLLPSHIATSQAMANSIVHTPGQLEFF